MNNVKQATRQQESAAEILAEWYERVEVGTPNAHGNLLMTAYNGELPTCSWIVAPSGVLIYKHFKHEDAKRATMDYQHRYAQETT